MYVARCDEVRPPFLGAPFRHVRWLSAPSPDGLDVAEVCLQRAACAESVLPDSVMLVPRVDVAQLELRSLGCSWRLKRQASGATYLPSGMYQLLNAQRDIPMMAIRVPSAFERTVLQVEGWQQPTLPMLSVHDLRLRRLIGRLSGDLGLEPHLLLPMSISAVNRALELMCRRVMERAHPFTRTMADLLRHYIDDNIGHPERLRTIEDLTGLGRALFDRSFLSAFGAPRHHYVAKRRVALASHRLQDPGQSLTQIAHELGFSSHAHFSTAFKNAIGRSPTEFRNGFGTTTLNA